jgi:hypothetical protein
MRLSLPDGGRMMISLIDFDLGGRGEYSGWVAFCFSFLEDFPTPGKVYGNPACITDILLI